MKVTEQNLVDLKLVEGETEAVGRLGTAPTKLEEEDGNWSSMFPELEHFCQITE